MLASSPRDSPKTISSTYSSSNNGSSSNAISIYSPRHPSPRFKSNSRSPLLSDRVSLSQSQPASRSPLINTSHTTMAPAADAANAIAGSSKTTCDTIMASKATPASTTNTTLTKAKRLPSIHPLTPETKRRQPSTSEHIVDNESPTQKRSKPAQKTPKELPIKYEHCANEDMVVLIADMIAELIEVNDKLKLDDDQLTRYHSRTPPGISVLDYLQRLAKHATLTPAILLSTVYYIDRLCSLYPAFTVTSLTVHRFLITAATVASKGLSDSFWNNSTYARVGGLKLSELTRLELDFLYRMDWRIVPNAEVLVSYYKALVTRNGKYVFRPDIFLSGVDDRTQEEKEREATSYLPGP